jgi:hypothetical protein
MLQHALESGMLLCLFPYGQTPFMLNSISTPSPLRTAIPSAFSILLL